MLYDVGSVKKKVSKLYESGVFFHSFMEGKSLFPFEIKLKTPSQKSLLENLDTLSSEILKLEKLSLVLEYKEFSFQRLGQQRLPIIVKVESEEQLLKFLGKRKDFELYKKCYAQATTRFLALKSLFLAKPKFLLDNLKIIDKLLDIGSFFVENPRPNIYIRALSVKGVDTKFIQKYKKSVDTLLEYVLDDVSYDASITKLSENGFEKKYGLKYEFPLVRFRILDEVHYIHGLDDISLTTQAFEKLDLGCENIFIVENKITMLSFVDVKNSIVIFGNGYGLGMVKNAKWMQDKNIYYWGDIDMDGFAILSQARGYFSQTKSLFMDEKVIENFKDLAVSVEQSKYKNLEHLNEDETLLYERLYSDFYKENFRLEQERIPFKYIQEKINALR